jgi:NTE family protein
LLPILKIKNDQAKLIGLAMLPPGLFGTRADELSDLLREHWGVTANLSDLSEAPRWMINATCYETGKNWRFERFRMGDYRFG